MDPFLSCEEPLIPGLNNIGWQIWNIFELQFYKWQTV